MDTKLAPRAARTLPLPLAALGLSVAIAAGLLYAWATSPRGSLGDTDDAMRLVLVRDLMSGRAAWFDLHVEKLQPPLGLDMHWSRLVDAGIAGMIWLFGQVLPPDQAEAAARVVWPLLWLFPAVWAVLAMARRLGGVQAAFLAGVLLLANAFIYVQWRPGRIDHHGIQVAMALAAVAGAAQGGPRAAMLAGIATGAGLAVGLEGLPFLALAGACFALRFAFDPQAGAAPAARYALSLLVTASLLHLAQTPPERLAVVVCDAFAANLWGAVAAGCLGLAAAVRFTARRGLAARLGVLAVIGAVAGGIYAGAEPRCLGGPLGAIEPALRPIWLSTISEMQPLVHSPPSRWTALEISSVTLFITGLAGWAWLGRRREARSFAWGLMGACLVVGAVAAFDARRMVSYPWWLAIPLIAAAARNLGERFWKGRLVPALALVCATTPVAVLTVVGLAPQARLGGEPGPSTACVETASYATLARQPPGVVLAEVNLGSFILANTPHSALAAPYHRMDWGMLKSYAALAAPPGRDEAAVRALKADYVLGCPSRHMQPAHDDLGPQSLQARLDAGRPPAWLEPVSAPMEPLQVYRVRPNPSAGGSDR